MKANNNFLATNRLFATWVQLLSSLGSIAGIFIINYTMFDVSKAG